MSSPKSAYFYPLLAGFFLCVLAGCSRSDRAVMDQSQSLIDQKRYGDAVAFLNKEIPNHPASARELKTKLAFAYLGKSGVELMELANQINIFKSFKSVRIPSDAIKTVCHDMPYYESEVYIPFVCLPIIKFDYFPEPDQPDFAKAMQIFNDLNPDPKTTDEDINLLLAIVNLGATIKNYDHLVSPPAEFINSQLGTDRELQIRAATYTLKYVKRTFSTFFGAFNRLIFSYGKIRRFFDKFKNKPLLKIGSYTYYATDAFSGDDFVKFLLTSAKDEINSNNGDLDDKQTQNLNQLTDGLRHALYALRFQLNIGNSDISEMVNHMLEVGADWVPDRFKIDVNQKIPVDLLNPAVLPKVIQRSVKSVRDSWTQENAQFIFDEVTDLTSQYNQMESLTTSWNDFWQSLDSDAQADVKARAENFKNEIPFFNLDGKQKPDFKALGLWYHSSMKTLARDSDQLAADYPNNLIIQGLPNLIRNSDEWISENLW